jgi:flagellar motor switch protein FliM
VPGVTLLEPQAAPAHGKQPRSVEVYDFRRPTTLAREHSRVLELAFDTFARQWGTQLTAKVRVLSQVTCEQVGMYTYDEYAASLPATTAMVLCTLENFSAKAVLQFPASAALSWVGYMLGGTGVQPAPDRKFTHVEQALIRRLMDDALEDLRYSLGSLLATPISVSSIQYNSQFAQAAAKSDLMIVGAFEIRVGDRTAPATLAMPADVLLPQLGETNPTSSAGNARELLDAQVAAVPVDVALQLTAAVVTPAMILGLSVGDILPIPHAKHRPLDVTVDGHPIASAAVGANGSRLAGVVITAKEF